MNVTLTMMCAPQIELHSPPLDWGGGSNLTYRYQKPTKNSKKKETKDKDKDDDPEHAVHEGGPNEVLVCFR